MATCRPATKIRASPMSRLFWKYRRQNRSLTTAALRVSNSAGEISRPRRGVTPSTSKYPGRMPRRPPSVTWPLTSRSESSKTETAKPSAEGRDRSAFHRS